MLDDDYFAMGNYLSGETSPNVFSGLTAGTLTLTPELPTVPVAGYAMPNNFNWLGTTSQPALADIDRSTNAYTVSGVLKDVSATAKTLTGIYTDVVNLGQSAAQAKTDAQISRSQLELNKLNTLGVLEVTRAKVGASQAIEKARAEQATTEEIARIKSGAGSAAENGISLALVIAIGAGLYFMGKK